MANEGFDELAALLAAKRLSGSAEERLIQLFDVYLDHGLRNPRLFELMFLTLRPGRAPLSSGLSHGELLTVLQVPGYGHFAADL